MINQNISIQQYFLVAGVSEKRSAPEVLDPFEAARAQVLAILEEG